MRDIVGSMSASLLPVARTVAVLAILIPHAAPAQSPSGQPEAEIARAPSLYYAPHSLESFRCTVTPDWDGIVDEFGGPRTLADQNDLLFLKSIRITGEDTLNQGGSLDWKLPDDSFPPPQLMGHLERLRRGLDQAFQTVFGLWNAVVTRDIFSQPDDASGITRDPSGWHTHEADSSQSIDETFDKDLFLTSMKTVDSNGTRIVKPKFTETPEGRIITSVELATTPPGSTATHTGRMSIAYASVDGFRLPSSVAISTAGLSFNFSLTNCSTVKARPAATLSGP